MQNYIIIHGSYGNSYKNWFPWLKEQLSKRKLNYIIPHFPAPFRQDYESWSKILNAYFEIGYLNEETIFITHSLGGIFIVKFLIEKKIKIRKLITVAGFNNIKFDEDNKLYDSFYINDKKLQEFPNLCEERICIYSNNDPFVPEKEAIYFADNINASKVLINNAGHFNEKFGYKEFKEIINFL